MIRRSLVLGLLWLLGVSAMDLMDELAGQWKMGLRPRDASQSLKVFDGALGGVSAAEITNSGDPDRPYEVGGDTFPDFETAGDRSCDNQMNDCADKANSGGQDFTVSDCNDQDTQCKEAVASATQTSFSVLVSSNAEFDFFCDE